MTYLEEKIKNLLTSFDDRQAARQPQRDAEEAQRQEELRQSYMRRTGRSELTPEIPASPKKVGIIK